MSTSVVDLRKLGKQYGIPGSSIKVFDGLDLTFYQGQITSIIGPSGCGKSTLLNIISGLDRNYSGVAHKNDKKLVGYLFQKDALIPWKTVYENIIVGMEILNAVPPEENRMQDILAEYGLGAYREYYPKMLSGGLRQRVALAQMLINDMDLILLDEPFSSQDFFTKIQLENLFYKNIKQKKLSALLVTHDIEEAIALSDRIVVLSQKPCRVLKDIQLGFRQNARLISPEAVRELPLVSTYFAEIYETLKPEL